MIPVGLIVGTALACMGELLHIIGMSTTYWMENKSGNGHDGIFRGCWDTTISCRSHFYKGDHMPCALNAVQAMSVLGMILGLFGVCLIIAIIICRIKEIYTFDFMLLCLTPVCLFPAAVSIFIGVIVYGTVIHDYYEDNGYSISYGYSFILSIVGAFLLVPAGVLIIFEARPTKSFNFMNTT